MTTNTEVAGTSGSLDTSEVGVSSQRLALLMLLAGAVLIFTVGFAQGSGVVSTMRHTTPDMLSLFPVTNPKGK